MAEINRNQLRLFLDPVHHQETVETSTDSYDDVTGSTYDTGSSGPGTDASMARMWARKEAESRVSADAKGYNHGNGLYDMLARGEQIHTPVQVRVRDDSFQQYEGHHRIAAAAALQRDTGVAQHVPVEYSDSRWPHNGMGKDARDRRPRIKAFG